MFQVRGVFREENIFIKWWWETPPIGRVTPLSGSERPNRLAPPFFVIVKKLLRPRVSKF